MSEEKSIADLLKENIASNQEGLGQAATPEKVAEVVGTPNPEIVNEQSEEVIEEPEIDFGEKKYKKSELEKIIKDKENDTKWREANTRKSQELAEEKRKWEAQKATELAEIEAAKQAKIELEKIKATEEYAFIQEQLKNNSPNTEVDLAEIVRRELAAEKAKAEASQKAQETAKVSEQFWKGVDEKGDAFFASKLEEIQVLDPSFDIERAKIDSAYYNENPILKSMSENIGYALERGIIDPEKALQFAFSSAVAAQEGGIDKIAEHKASKKTVSAVKALAGNAGKATTVPTRTATPPPLPYDPKNIGDVLRYELNKK